MQSTRSPPKSDELKKMGGSTLTAATAVQKASAQSRLLSSHTGDYPDGSMASTSTLNSNSSSTARLLESSTESLKKSTYYQHNYSHSHGHHNYHYHYRSNNGGSGGGSGSNSRTSSTGKHARNKNWGTRERTGMSFLIVIAFFAVFGLIILTEFFMIDERSHSAMVMLRHGNGYGGRMGDSMPDYDNVKDDYDLLDDSLLGDNKLGFVQFRDNKLKIQDAGNGDGRLAGILLNSGGVNGHGVGAGSIGTGGNAGFNVPQIPWGKVLPTKIEETLPPYPIGLQPSLGSWQVVNGTRFKFFVFSAYYDRRDGAKLVRVIGATKTRGPERVWCRFWYLKPNATTTTKDGERIGHRYTSVTVMARVKIIRENWNLKYSACFILCPVRTPEIDVPHFVSIVSRLRAPPGNLLTLKNTDWDAELVAMREHLNVSNASAGINPYPTSPIPTGDRIPDKIAVCVKPFHFSYDKALYLLEFLELYALLGVSHFTFYNHTLGPHATCVLEKYMNGDVPDNLTAVDNAVLVKKPTATTAPAHFTKQNQSQTQTQTNAPLKASQSLKSNYVKPTINILPWDLRMRSQKEIRTEGLFAALNDCIYRNMYRYKYLALVDLDEFIVPRQNDTLYDLISSINHRLPTRNIGAYYFQNAFFYLQFPDDALAFKGNENDEDARIHDSLVTQRKTKRRFKLHPQKQRSKYICEPEAVVEAGNHFIWEFSPGKGSLYVAPTEAILQHYRVCEFGGNDCIKAPSVTDRTATKYANRLVQRVKLVYNHLKTKCNLPDLPTLSKSTPTSENDNENNEKTLSERTKPVQSKVKNNERKINTTETENISTSFLEKTNITTTAKSESKTNKDGEIPLHYKRKIVVFENDENGVMRAKLKYL